MALQGSSQVSNSNARKTGGNKTGTKQAGDGKTASDVSRRLLSQFGNQGQGWSHRGQGHGGVQFETASFNLTAVTMPGRRPTKFKDKVREGSLLQGEGAVIITRLWEWSLLLQGQGEVIITR